MKILDVGVRDTVPSAGLLLIRVFLGLGIAAHGWQKFFSFGISGFAKGLEQMGVPAPSLMAAISAGTELLGGLLIAAGLLTRPAGAFLAFNMLVAAFLAHGGAYFLPKGMEYALNLAIVYLALALTGPGKFSVDRFIAKKETAS